MITDVKQNTADVDWTQAPLTDLVRHILDTHHEYLKAALPRINDLLKHAIRAGGASGQSPLGELNNVFGGLWDELDGHLHKEEMILFPFIERMADAAAGGRPLPPTPFGSIANPIAMMGREHDDAGDALRQIRHLTGDFNVTESGSEIYSQLISELKALDIDLSEHIRLENEILFPRAVGLERRS